MRIRDTNKAFTLIELSIVITIIGLLVGGVLAGRSIIHSSEVRSIAVERSNIQTAFEGFRDKYNALPGDFGKAYNFWGPACGNNDATASTGCNGDDSQGIEASEGEGLKVWMHLRYAGYIEGSMDGKGTHSSLGMDYLVLSTTNTYKSKYPNAYWDISDYFFGMGGEDGVPEKWGMSYFLNFGTISKTPNSLPAKGVQTTMVPTLTIGDAWNLDVKTDDGQANTGNMIGDGYDDHNTGYGACYDVDLGDGTWDYYNMKNHDIDHRGGGSAAGVCQLHWIFTW